MSAVSPGGSPVGVSHAHTSVPASQPLLPARGANCHIVVADRVSESLTGLIHDLVMRGGRDSVELICVDAAAARLADTCRVISATEAGLAAALQASLATARVGVHVYVQAVEPRSQSLAQVARIAGLDGPELTINVTGPPQRRVRCVHCRQVLDTDAETRVACRGCGRMLLIYHHFSRRHGAHMGFQADAEVPGEFAVEA